MRNAVCHSKDSLEVPENPVGKKERVYEKPVRYAVLSRSEEKE